MRSSGVLTAILTLIQSEGSLPPLAKEKVIAILTGAPEPIQPRLLSLTDSARWCSVSRQTFHSWVKQGVIKPAVIAGMRRYRLSDLEDLVSAKESR